MVFSSIVFLFLFLPLTLALYYVLRPAYRNWILLFSSLLFYFWGEGKYLSVMIFYMLFNYAAGFAIEKLRDKEKIRWSKTIFILSIAVNTGLLLFFKYITFILTNLNNLAEVFHRHVPVPEVHLPIGISFFAFQALSYIIDVYRRDVKAQQNVVNFSMYKSLFPQLIAGPIVRYKDVSSQITGRVHSTEKFAAGLKRFIIGLGKKVLIANNVASFADSMFQNSGNDLSTVYAWLGILCYALQIYFDFSGYSDMAIGLGKMFGFDFLENFNYPYISRSIKEFWRRWHISLSSWFRDYVYISLGGNRAGKYRTWFNLLVVFFLCGLWHGASWTFVAWGLWHGLFLVLERTPWGKIVDRMPSPIMLLYTVLVILTGWVLFRSDNMHQAVQIFQAMFFLGSGGLTQPMNLTVTVILALIAGIIGSTPWPSRLINRLKSSNHTAITVSIHIGEALWLLGLFVTCAIVLSTATYNPFIYFRF